MFYRFFCVYATDIFSDMCGMLWRSGHTEKAVACFQALIEFNVNCPLLLQQASHDDKVEIFEAFWGSSAARVGDKGANGWHDWVAKKASVPAVALDVTKGSFFCFVFLPSRIF